MGNRESEYTIVYLHTDPTVRGMMVSQLSEGSGFHVTGVSSLNEMHAAAVSSKKPDVIVLPIDLYTADDSEAIQEKIRDLDVPVIVLAPKGFTPEQSNTLLYSFTGQLDEIQSLITHIHNVIYARRSDSRS